MRVTEITSSDNLQEAPAGFIKQGLKKLGAKAAGAVGMKGTAAGLAGSAKTGDQANKLKVDLQGYLGQTGGSMKNLDAQDLKAFLASKKLPTNMVPASGLIPKKELDNILLKTAQQSNKAKGAPAVGSASSGSGAAPGGAPAGAGGSANAPAGGQAQGGAPAPNDANNDGKDDTTGKVIPMQKPAPGKPSGSTEIPPNIQKQLDGLSPTERKVVAGLI
jgi:hypothetical protein